MYNKIISFTKYTNFSLACSLCFLYFLYKLFVNRQVLIKLNLLKGFINYVFIFNIEKGLKGKVNNMATILNLVVNQVLKRKPFFLKGCKNKIKYFII